MRARAGGSARALGLLCVAGALVVLLAHSSTRPRERETNDTRQMLLLCTFTDSSSRLGGERFMRWSMTAALWGVRGEVLGEGREWRGHGVKLNLLRERLRELVDAGRGGDVVLYTDSYDVMFVGPVAEAAARFVGRGDAGVVFGAELKCEPDDSMCGPLERAASPGLYPYLNAGVVIGYAGTLHELVSQRAVGDEEDDQRYYTRAFLSRTLRERLAIRLDQRAEIFQCLYNVSDHVRVVSVPGAWSHVENSLTGSRPLVLHGSGESRPLLWEMEASLVSSWTSLPARAPTHLLSSTALHKELPELAELYGLTREDDVGDAADY